MYTTKCNQHTLPPNLCYVLKLKNYYRHRYQRSHLPLFHYLFQLFTQIFSTHLIRLCNFKWSSFSDSLHTWTNQLWKVAHYFTKSPSSIPPHPNSPGCASLPHPTQAEVLAQQFECSHYLTLNMGTPHYTTTITRFVDRFFCIATPHTSPLQLTNIYEVKWKIFSMKLRSAPGNDRITPLMLCRLSRKTLTHLTHLFNHLLRLGYFPTCWKKAKVVPVPKPNKPGTDPNSYRPFSLLITLRKLFECIIAVRLTSFVNLQHLLPHAQFGFHKKHSTVCQLARITDYISNGYNLHKHTGMVLLDLEKAYSTVWIHGLHYKLIFFKLPTYLLFILKAFLEGHSFTVHLHEMPSSPRGLPQGVVLSTTLFALYISDMPHPPNMQLVLYADDTAILTQSWRTDTILHRLTHATCVLVCYFTSWKIQVNIHKTEAILFTRRRPVPPAPLHFQHTVIPWNAQVQYLGLLLDPKLLFTRHITSITQKATGIFLQIFPLLARDSTLSIPNEITLYKLLIRSMLTYAAPVWSNTSSNYR